MAKCCLLYLFYLFFNVNCASVLDHIQTFVTITMENWSFDSILGGFPGLDGVENAKNGLGFAQRDLLGNVYTVLPFTPIDIPNRSIPDPRFASGLPNKPFLFNDYVKLDSKIVDCVHRFYTNMRQVNGGKNDKFVAWTDCGGSVLGYWDLRNTIFEELVENFTTCNRFFQSAFGGSYLNHQWMVCGCTPRWADGPSSMRAVLEKDGGIANRTMDVELSPDGYTVNNVYTKQTPFPPGTAPEKLVGPYEEPNIGDILSSAGISWKWYAGGWNDALAGNPAPTFQFHHQPFAYYKSYPKDSDNRKAHLQDEENFRMDLQAGQLPQVSWLKPLGANNMHRGYTNMQTGIDWLTRVINGLKASPQYSNMLIILTFDENGGMWDHVAPPQGDRWGPGNRIPTFLIGPYVKEGFIDNTYYDHTSILKTIQERFNLPSMTERDAAANDFSNALNPFPSMKPSPLDENAATPLMSWWPLHAVTLTLMSVMLS